MADTPKVDLKQLVLDHQAGVWRYLRMLGCDPQKADDLTQEVFLGVLKRPFDNYSFEASAAYLRRAAKLHFLSSLRKEDRNQALNFVETVDATWVDGQSGQSDELEALDRCLEKLDQRQRQALDLRYRDKAERRKIAKALGLSEDGAKNLIQRAKHKLRQCIELRLKIENDK